MTLATPPEKRPGSYVFDRFRLSEDGTLLLERGAAVAAAPKVLQTLLVLVERAGQVVTKNDLVSAVWPDTIVEETGLTRNISVLRQMLADDGQRFITTVPRIGYRFVATVRHERPDPAETTQFVTGPNEGMRAKRRGIIVGHRQERAQLNAAFATTQKASGKCIAVCGEPGIGKTTIVEDFLAELTEPVLVGQGRCSERLAGAEPHLAVLEALDELFAQDHTLVGLLRRLAPTWYVHVAPRFKDGPSESQFPEHARSGSADRLMRELTSFLEEISRTRPVVIFIDDLHWSDVSTVDLVAHLATRLGRMRVMLITAYRSNEIAAANHPFNRLRGELIGRGQLTEIAVSLLTGQDVREYVLSQFAKDNVSGDLPRLVYRKTEGNPLFMTDLVRYLRENELSKDDVVQVTREVPESLKGMIERTLQALNPDAQQLLRISALYGNEFESGIVATVTGRNAADVEEHLQTLAHVHGLITIVREHALPDGTFSLRCRFVHVLYQNALFISTMPSRRADWAHQIAESLERSYAAKTELIASELAVLFEIARDFRKASQYFLSASRTASGRFAYREARDFARRGLECLRMAPLGTNENATRLEVELMFALFMPLASIQGYGSSEVESVLERLLQLCESSADTAIMAAVLSATWILRMVRGECIAAKDAGSRLISLARSARDDILLLNGHSQVEIACHHMGEFREAQEHANEAITLEPAGRYPERCLSILDPVVAALAESSRNLMIMGYLKRATEHCEQAVEIGTRIGHPDSLAFAWFFHGLNRGSRRDWSASLQSANTGISVASEGDSVQTLAWNRCVRGWSLGHLGRPNEGLEELAAAIESSKSIMGQVGFPQQIVMIVEVLLIKGDVNSALQWIAQALELSNLQYDRYFDAELHRLWAVCLLKRGQREGALGQLTSALDVANCQEAALFRLRSALTFAEHDLNGWRDVLSSALVRFPEPEPWPDIEAAHCFSGDAEI
jgi:DNA-binding winged helix-turn-helix (wHTH) protein/tetratricopeptide (TPR) repeat protein